MSLSSSKYNHIDFIWPQLLDTALESPLCDAKQDRIREIVGACFVLDGSMEQFLLNPRRKLNPIYASAELLWYLSRSKSGDMIKAYAPQYEQFLDKDGTAFGAYGYRLGTALGQFGDSLKYAISLLRQRGTTKKCVISLWRPNDLVHEMVHRDIPCTLTWQFLLRGERLHMVCSMRSQDLWKGCLYDIYINTIIQRYVAAQLGVTAGNYHHMVGSMHLYERDTKKAEEAIQSSQDYFFDGSTAPSLMNIEPYHPSACNWSDDELRIALEAEEAMRRGNGSLWSSGFFGDSLNDAVECCRAKWCNNHDPVNIRAPGLRRGMEQFLGRSVRSESA